jgi:hypothetical protein
MVFLQFEYSRPTGPPGSLLTYPISVLNFARLFWVGLFHFIKIALSVFQSISLNYNRVAGGYPGVLFLH